MRVRIKNDACDLLDKVIEVPADYGKMLSSLLGKEFEVDMTYMSDDYIFVITDEGNKKIFTGLFDVIGEDARDTYKRCSKCNFVNTTTMAQDREGKCLACGEVTVFVPINKVPRWS